MKFVQVPPPMDECHSITRNATAIQATSDQNGNKDTTHETLNSHQLRGSMPLPRCCRPGARG